MDYLKISKNFKIPITKTTTIELKIDTSCDMAWVLVNGESVMMGNSCDFYNGCHGFYEIPEFNSADGLVNVLKNEISKLNISSSIEILKGEFIY